MDLCRNSFHPFVTEPDLFLQVRSHWITFNDYLNALSSKYRIRAKKVFAVSQDLEVKNLSLEEIIEARVSRRNVIKNNYNRNVQEISSSKGSRFLKNF